MLAVAVQQHAYIMSLLELPLARCEGRRCPAAAGRPASTAPIIAGRRQHGSAEQVAADLAASISLTGARCPGLGPQRQATGPFF